MKLFVRLVIVAVALGLFFYLFLRSARSARSEAYVVPAANVSSWTLALGEGSLPSSPVLVLRPPQAFGTALFDQIFTRMMESMRGSPGRGIPIVLRGEFDGALAGRYSPASLLDAARAAGLESANPTPVCVAHRRISEPGVTRQLYYVLFTAPEIRDFRRRLVADVVDGAGPAAFDPLALSPVMIVAASDDRFDSWMPITANTDAECVAPISVE